MPIGMPYHLEKGATLRLIEQHLNQCSRDELRGVLDVLQAEVNKTTKSPTWLADAIPALWTDPAFQHSPANDGDATRLDIIEKWLGFERKRDGTWFQPPAPTTGYWIAYKGNVNEIMLRALTWAVELALGLEPGGTGKGRREPWPIELFWKCPAPWFEAWVVNRPINKPGSKHRGLISVFFITPSHEKSNVAENPIAAHAKASVANIDHPVPSWQDDYEQLGAAFPDPAVTDRPRVKAKNRHYAMWIVTHADHTTNPRRYVTTNTTEFADFAEWGIPRLSIYEGQDPVVIVSPSMASGGVKWDGGL